MAADVTGKERPAEHTVGQLGLFTDNASRHWLDTLDHVTFSFDRSGGISNPVTRALIGRPWIGGDLANGGEKRRGRLADLLGAVEVSHGRLLYVGSTAVRQVLGSVLHTAPINCAV